MTLATAVLAYAAAVNAVAFCLFGWDKRRARTGGRRVPESTLLALAAAGGLAGAYAAKPFFRHKTVKSSFRWKLHAILVAWIAIAAAWVARGAASEQVAYAPASPMAAKELEKRAGELLRAGRTSEAFDKLKKILETFPDTGPSALVILPLKIDTIPSGKEVWINGFYRDRTPNIFKYSPEHEDLAKTPLHVEIREDKRVLWAQDLDPTVFHDLTIDCREK